VSEPDISVVVVNFNGRPWLDRCLSAVERQDGVRAETILVDNGSADESVAFVRDRFPAVRLVTFPTNLGFTGGANAGSAVARGRWLAFLNNDTEPEAGWLRALSSGLDESPQVAVVTSRIVSMDDPTRVDSAGDGWFRCGAAFKRGHGDPSSAWGGDAENVFGACAAACMIRRDVFEALGGFDESFFITFEDVDLSYRARLAGYECRYVPGAVVRHAGSATLGRLSRRAVFYGQRNLEWVYAKNTPLSLLPRTLPGHLAYTLAAAMFFLSRGRFLAFLAAKAAVVAGLPRVLRARRVVQRRRRVTAREIWRWMEPRWFARKWREKRFDWTVPPRG
jgi:GT2 family glycosyltransferase